MMSEKQNLMLLLDCYWYSMLIGLLYALSVLVQ